MGRSAQASLHSSLQYLLLAAFWFREVSLRAGQVSLPVKCQTSSFTQLDRQFFMSGRTYHVGVTSVEETWPEGYSTVCWRINFWPAKDKFTSSWSGVRCSNQRASKPFWGLDRVLYKVLFFLFPKPSLVFLACSSLGQFSSLYKMSKIMNKAHLQSLLTSQGKKRYITSSLNVEERIRKPCAG